MMHKIIDFFRDYPAVREWDDNGLLNSAGFTWKEIAWPVFQVFGTGAFVLYFYALGCMSDKRTPPEFTKMVVLAGVGCVLACIFMGRIKRGISFERDGRIRNRGGWVNWIDMLGTLKIHADIVSIEAVKQGEDFGVVMYTSWGGTHWAGSGLDEAHARLVARQLTIALIDLRTSMSSMASAQAQQQATKRPVWIE